MTLGWLWQRRDMSDGFCNESVYGKLNLVCVR